MKVEHVAWQVGQPAAVADWYVAHLGMTVVRTGGPPSQARFLADSTGRTQLEIYNNPAAPVPDYSTIDPLVLHLAFVVEDLAAELARLVAAGATVAQAPTTTASGDVLAMLRDPWGFCLQLAHRQRAMP